MIIRSSQVTNTYFFIKGIGVEGHALSRQQLKRNELNYAGCGTGQEFSWPTALHRLRSFSRVGVKGSYGAFFPPFNPLDMPGKQSLTIKLSRSVFCVG
jgi:hypothetical protein